MSYGHNLITGTAAIPLTLDGTNFLLTAGTDGGFVNGTEVDMQVAGNFTGCLFVILVGVIAATGVITMRLKNSATSGSYGAGTIDRIGSDYANAADTDDNKVFMIDVYRPQRRYLRMSLQRTTGNVTVNGAVAIQYNPSTKPAVEATASVMAATANLNNPTPSAT